MPALAGAHPPPARRGAALAALLLGLALPLVAGCGGEEKVPLGGAGSDCLAGGPAACASSICLQLDSGTAYCSQACQGKTDCPEGFLCVSAGAQGLLCQSRGAGGVCAEDADCPAGLKCDAGPARCYVPVTRSACGTCTSDKQCGAGGTCHAEGSGDTYCAPACGAGDTCPAGYLCAAAADAGGAKRCLPSNSAGQAGSCRGGRALCAPCTGDLECGKPGDVCVRNLISDESFCGTRCTANADCPAHFSCTDLSGKGLGPRQCTPDSGTCAGYCDSTDPATVARECGLGSTCDLANRACKRKTDGTLCAACSSDDECIAGVASARCIVNRTPGSPFQGEQFCGSDCSSGTCPGAGCTKNAAACSAGFACIGIGAGGAWPYQCAPVRGTCQGGLQTLGASCDRFGAADCVSGLCGRFGAERRCTATCTADAACGDARWRCCKAVGDNYDCSQPANGAAGICAPMGGSFGDDCAPGSPPCQEGLCLDLGTAQLCTRGCDTTHPCAAGFSCQAAAVKAADGTVGSSTQSVCFPDGGGDLGSACAFGPAACKSHLCLKKDSGNVCTKACLSSADCPSGWGCDTVNSATGGQVQACLPPGAGP